MYDYDHQTCNQCQEHQNTLEEVRYWAQSLLDLFYSPEDLEPHTVEHCLEELAHQVGLKLPECPINLTKRVEESKDTSFNEVMEAWKSANHSYLSNLT